MSKFASLTAGLLARKGEAEPAATPFADQLLTRVGAPDSAADVRSLTPLRVHSHVESGTPVKAQLVRPAGESSEPIFGAFGRRSALEAARAREDALSRIVRSTGGEAVHTHDDDDPAGSNCGACAGTTADDAGKTYHVNLRMKRQRFVKLKLSSALLRRPVQDIVAEALDAWFDRLPTDVLGDCACMKSRCD
jgi:hypothetical protein